VTAPGERLTPNARGEIIDRQCPVCGAWATEHVVLAHLTVAPGLRTMADMQKLPVQKDVLICPR